MYCTYILGYDIVTAMMISITISFVIGLEGSHNRFLRFLSFIYIYFTVGMCTCTLDKTKQLLNDSYNTYKNFESFNYFSIICHYANDRFGVLCTLNKSIFYWF